MKSYIVDSFTKHPFKGNPAGVCFPDHRLDDEKMLQIAGELGFSETAFVRETSRTGIYTIRYFSPKKEIPLCGHATLASAKIVFEKTKHDEIHFITRENVDLSITRKGSEITMRFPVYPTTPATVPSAMRRALGLTEIKQTSFSPQNKIIIIEIADADELASLRPDFNSLLASYEGINGVLVTAPSATLDYDFHYRYFWPWAGTDEDPVTGGVQTFLAKYWSEKLGKTKMSAFQSSSRTGSMKVELSGEIVFVTGEAVIVFEGKLAAFDASS
jgi:PhzF family phenazine biosynthesis protein